MKKLLVVVVILVVAIGVIMYATPRATSLGGGVACTTDTKTCLDGSSVGRTGPRCEFAACPAQATSTRAGAPIVGAGEHCGGNIRLAPVCIIGYHCELTVSRPDTGGTCVAGSSGSENGVLQYNSGIQGTVLVGPTCPVVKNPPDPQCADKPYQTSIRFAHASSPDQVVASAQSATDGTFKVSLSPGDYVINAQGGTMLPRCAQASATVSASGYTHVAVSCDSGIR